LVEDLTIPEGTTESPGAIFTKIWRMKNTGSCAWSRDFKFAFSYGNKMGGDDFSIMQQNDMVEPGASRDFGVTLTAPSVPGTYTGCWKMQSDRGYWFGQAACAIIKVIP